MYSNFINEIKCIYLDVSKVSRNPSTCNYLLHLQNI